MKQASSPYEACFVSRCTRMNWLMKPYVFFEGYKGVKKAARLSRFFYAFISLKKHIRVHQPIYTGA